MLLNYLLTVLFLVTPTLVAWRWCAHLFLHIESRLLKGSISVALGQFALTGVTLVGASTLFTQASSPILYGSLAATGLLAISALLCPYKGQPFLIPEQKWTILIPEIAIVATFLAFSFYLFSLHLWSEDGTLYTSSVYWDLGCHASLIQSFARGGNFPPSNELVFGIPLLYHYMHFLLVAIYTAHLGLVSGIVLTSTAGFALMLTTIVGVTEELFASRRAGIVACGLSLTSSSLFFIDFFNREDFWKILFARSITQPDEIPFSRQDSFAYNGNMFNLFYFIEERQLPVACLLMLYAALLYARRDRLPGEVLIAAGIVFGCCLKWHLFAVVAVLAAGGLIFLLGKERKKTLQFLLPFASLFAAQSLWLKYGMDHSAFQSELFDVPRLNMTFASNYTTGSDALEMIPRFWAYALGAKLLLLPLGAVLLGRRFPAASLATFALISAAFLLTNTTMLSPVSIYENHKWERPMLLLVDIISAMTLIVIFDNSSKFSRFGGVLVFLLCSLSGIIENFGYLRTQGESFFARYPSEASEYIEKKTPLRSTFFSDSPLDVMLSGRGLYAVDVKKLPSPRADLIFTQQDTRSDTIQELKRVDSKPQFCKIARSERIDYFEIFAKADESGTWPDFKPDCFSELLHNSTDRTVRFLSISCACTEPDEIASERAKAAQATNRS